MRMCDSVLSYLNGCDTDSVDDVGDGAAAAEVVHRLHQALHDGAHRHRARRLLHCLVRVVA